MILGSNWRWPDIPGLHDFNGKLLHSAHWDNSYDFQNKTVAIIGSGSSAIQIVPQLQPGESVRATTEVCYHSRISLRQHSGQAHDFYQSLKDLDHT